MNIDRCLLKSNSATSRGGGLHSTSGSSSVVNGSMFSSNFGGDGGALASSSYSTVLIGATKFDLNTASNVYGANPRLCKVMPNTTHINVRMFGCGFVFLQKCTLDDGSIVSECILFYPEEFLCTTRRTIAFTFLCFVLGRCHLHHNVFHGDGCR